MKHPILKVVVLGALLLSSGPPAVHAQSFSVDWFVVAGGGGSCAGGEFALDGTFGQSDATEQPLTGDVFSLTGGFWSLFAPSDSASQSSAGKNFVTTDDVPTADSTASNNASGASSVAQTDGSPNVFAAAAGTYQGLFYSSNGAAPQSAGFVDAKVTTTGAFSARFQLADGGTSLSGQFPATGLFSNSVPSPSSGSITVQLQLNLLNSTLAGQISGSNWTANLLANRAVYSRTNPAPQAGRYALLISGGTNSAQPGDNGFGAVTVDGSGHVTFSGTLGDGTPATATAMLGGQGQWPFFIPLYSGAGSILGWLTFSNTPDSDISGLLSWIKLAQLAASLDPAGFTNITTATGSVYRP